MKFETILVPTDFSDHAEKALETAIELAKVFGSRIELLNAYDFGQWVTLADVTFAERAEEKLRLVASKKLQSLVKRIETDGVEVSTHVSFGAPSLEIVERAEKTNADLIVMGTRGLGAVKQLFLGSVAARTIQTAPCPVLTIAADDLVESKSAP